MFWPNSKKFDFLRVSCDSRSSQKMALKTFQKPRATDYRSSLSVGGFPGVALVDFDLILASFFISLITRMRCKRDIKMGRLCTPRGAVVGIVGGGVTFRFLNCEAILDENMLFWVRLCALAVVLKILLDFRL